MLGIYLEADTYLYLGARRPLMCSGMIMMCACWWVDAKCMLFDVTMLDLEETVQEVAGTGRDGASKAVLFQTKQVCEVTSGGTRGPCWVGGLWT